MSAINYLHIRRSLDCHPERSRAKPRGKLRLTITSLIKLLHFTPLVKNSLLLSSPIMKRFVHIAQLLISNMRINLRCCDGRMSEH